MYLIHCLVNYVNDNDEIDMAWSVTGNMIVPRSILAGCGIV